MAEWLKISITIFVFAVFYCEGIARAETRRPPADNDETYKLPIYVPKAALPKNAPKVQFNDAGADNDEMYTMPKAVKATPTAAAATVVKPAAAASQAEVNYQKQYEEYQRQLKVYNQQMEEYQRQLNAQQQKYPGTSMDNDSNYQLPNQYSPTRRTAPIAKQPQHTAPQQQQHYNAPQQQQPHYQAPAQHQTRQSAPPRDNDADAINVMPNYYY